MDESLNTPWHTGGGSNDRRGIFHGRVEIETKPARMMPAPASVQASVVSGVNGRTIIADMGGLVQAFTPGGKRLWRRQLDGGVSATPAIEPAGSMLYAGTHTGRVYGLDSADGTVAWQTEIPTKSDARILSDLLFLPKRHLIVLSSWGGRYVALDSDKGKEVQSWDAGISPSSGAMADEDENVYCLRAGRESGIQFVRIEPKGGETVLYSQGEKGRSANRLVVSAAPVLDAGRKVVYFVVNDLHESALKAWSLETGSLKWSCAFSVGVVATPAVAMDGTVMIADMAGILHAVDPDGSRRYRYVSGAEYLLAGGVCDMGGTLFVGDSLGAVHVIPPNGAGRQIFAVPRSIQARPSFDTRGNLYMPATDRRVYVFTNRHKA